jgi:hypothetical protein
MLTFPSVPDGAAAPDRVRRLDTSGGDIQRRFGRIIRKKRAIYEALKSGEREPVRVRTP